MTPTNHIESARAVLRNAKRVFVLTGAGVSAESGVPTFRGGGGAPVWRGMPFELLSSAEMVERDLPLVWEWFDYRRNLVSKCNPNTAHESLARAPKSGRFEEFTLVTQNIDGLHQAAGAENVIELHGSLWQARCLSCKTRQSLREIPEDERPPVCPECFDSMRPDVILFGEAMPMHAVREAQEAAKKCDVCLVVGTSALVYPAAELPLIAKHAGAKVIEINPEETSLTAEADVPIRGKAAEILPQIFCGKADRPGDNVSGAGTGQAFLTGNHQEIVDHKATAKAANGSLPTSGERGNPAQSSPPRGNVMTSETHPLRVDFIRGEEYPILNKLGLTFAPGKKQTGAISGNWDRDLAADLTRLKKFYNADTLVSLIEESEISELGIANFERECRMAGIELIRFPLKDVSVPPSLKNFAGLIYKIVKRLERQKTVVIHCKGGLGRAGLTAACSIAAASENKISASDAIKMVRLARTGAVETKEQEDFVSRFGEYTFHAGFGGFDQRNGWGERPETQPETRQSFSDKHFLLYWKEKSVAAHEESGYPLDVISSRQLERVKAGDTLWIVTIDQAGELILAGRLKVAEIVDYKTAVQRLDDTNLWDGRLFALPNEGGAEYLRRININDVALELRFANSVADRFVLKDGKINAQQLRTMRQLTGQSADLLTQIWESTEDKEMGQDFKEDFDQFEEEENWTELLEQLRQLVREQPYNAEAHYNLGVALNESDLLEEANTAYRRAVELDPTYWAAYYNLGGNYLRTRELDEAEQAFQFAIRLAPEFAPARFMLGAVYGELGDFQKAIDVTKEGLECDPDDPMAYFNIGNFYHHLQNYEEAARWFEKSAEIAPDEPNTFFRLGKCFRQLGRKQEEFNAYLKAVGLAPLFFDAVFALGTAYAHLDGSEEGQSIGYFETGGDLLVDDPRVSFYIGLAQLALGELDLAREEQADLLETDRHLADKLQFFIDRYEPAADKKPAGAEETGANGSETYGTPQSGSSRPPNPEPDKLSRFQGCLLGGAVGDALGAPIEFDSIASIRQKFGELGLTDYAPAYGRLGAITDDTQMTLFTAEGLLRAAVRQHERGFCDARQVIYHAYLRWLETQNFTVNGVTYKSSDPQENSWLSSLPELNSRRAPGNSCLTALQSGKMGTVDLPVNNSKGCGGVMRVAPVGLFTEDAFRLACDAAAITHGHPTGYLSAGVLALIIRQIIEGRNLSEAIEHAVYEVLPQYDNYEETLAACDRAIRLAADKTVIPTPETVESLGGGWIAEEALAISIYCALAYENDFKKAVLLAVNHSGDSDSTGAITGNILGALHGVDAIPNNWLERLELKDAIAEIAEDLLIGFRTGDGWWNKYPGV